MLRKIIPFLLVSVVFCVDAKNMDLWRTKDYFPRQVTQKEHFEYNFDDVSGELTVKADAGSIYISKTSEKKIRIDVVMHAQKQEHLDYVEVKIDASISKVNRGVTIETERKKSRGSASIDYYIQVPEKTRLKKIKTCSGEIIIEDILGTIKVESNSGSVAITNSFADLEVEAYSGGVVIKAARDSVGKIKVDTKSGSIKIYNAGGKVDAESNSGHIEITQSDNAKKEIEAKAASGSIVILNASGSVDARASSGSITIEQVHLAKGAFIEADTNCGNIQLSLPKSIDAKVKARTKLGKVTSDLSLRKASRISDEQIEGFFGYGDAKIELETKSGNIRIRQK